MIVPKGRGGQGEDVNSHFLPSLPSRICVNLEGTYLLQVKEGGYTGTWQRSVETWTCGLSPFLSYSSSFEGQLKQEAEFGWRSIFKSGMRQEGRRRLRCQMIKECFCLNMVFSLKKKSLKRLLRNGHIHTRERSSNRAESIEIATFVYVFFIFIYIYMKSLWCNRQCCLLFCSNKPGWTFLFSSWLRDYIRFYGGVELHHTSVPWWYWGICFLGGTYWADSCILLLEITL